MLADQEPLAVRAHMIRQLSVKPGFGAKWRQS